MKSEFIALIIAGGSGTRFWPLSQKDRPKQYLNLFGNRSLIQQTVERISPLLEGDKIFICSTQAQEKLLNEQLPSIRNLIFEPEGKNTGPCILLSVWHLIQQGVSPKTPLVVLPADHYIGKADEFRSLVKQALQAARELKGLITFGIVPSKTHTGYGYIEAGESLPTGSLFKVRRFVEKPDLRKAEEFIQRKNFYWNSGMFVWTLETISQAFQQWMPREWEILSRAKNIQEAFPAYRTFPSVPIDVAVMEKANNVYVLPADIGWSDVGSWNALYEMTSGNHRNVVLSGNIRDKDSEGCLVQLPPGKKAALIGVQDLIIVETADTLLICHRSHDQKVREISKEFD